MTQQGYATPEATKLLKTRFSKMPYAPFGDTGIWVSKVAFGGYRVSDESDGHSAALEQSLISGVNLIDTSANYTDGSSEKLIGDVLTRLIKNKQINRNEVVIVTKAGYIQGQNWDRYEDQVGTPAEIPETWKLDNGLAHSIHPAFLTDQITRSLSRLNLEAIDVFLLHNPEYFFQYARQSQIPPAEARQMFDAQIAQAFSYLETEVSRGRIRSYGISSNQFPAPSGSEEFVNLETILEIAKRVDAAHFKVIQLPANLIEVEAFIEENQSENESVLNLASRNNLGVLINRPLNAMAGDQLLRLSTFPENPAAIEVGSAPWHRLISDIAVDEQLLPDALANDEEVLAVMPKLMACLHLLNPILDQMEMFESAEAWESALYGYFLPRLEYGLSVYSKSVNDPAASEAQLSGFVEHLQHLFLALTEYYRKRSNMTRMPILMQILECLPEDWESLKGLAAVAIRLLVESPKVSSVLVGMRDIVYVDQVTNAVSVPVTDPGNSIWHEIASLNLYN